MPEPRLSFAGIRLLKQFLMSPRASRAGADLGRAASIGPGTLYPLLARLETSGWLASSWEDGDPAEMGRPRRRFYMLTPTGRKKARLALASVQLERGP